MQDRYFGDIGDFAKYGLLRAVTTGEPPLRLAVLWYLVPDESHNDDGRHVDYLEPTPANLARFRDCDPELYDKLGDLVRAGQRSVSAVAEHSLLPPGTAYHAAPLDYSGVASKDRPRLRSDWLSGAHKAAAEADVVFLDPDNGLEVEHRRVCRQGAEVRLLRRPPGAVAGQDPRRLPARDPHRHLRGTARGPHGGPG